MRRAAQELGYVPNLAARNLAQKSSRMLGLLVPDVTDPVHGQIVASFVRAAELRGFTVIVQEGARDRDRRLRSMRTMIEQVAPGIAICGAPADPAKTAAAISPARTVFIFPECHVLPPDADPQLFGIVRSHDAAGIEAVIRHLLDRGCRRLSYVNGPDIGSNRLRRAALISALERVGIEPRIREYQGSTRASELGHICELVRRERPDALICYDDLHALHLLSALNSAGVRVPQDVAVTGFDGIVFADLANPALTTVKQATDRLGKLAAEMLVDAIVDGKALEQLVLPVELVERASSNVG